MSQLPGSPTIPLPRPAAPTGTTPPSGRLVVVALLLALAAVVFVNIYIYSVRQSVREGEFRFFRLRVAKDVGQVLEPEDVERVAVPERFRDAFRDAVEPNSAGEPLRLGDTFTRAAEQGEPLTTRMFDDLTGDATRRLINPGFRGVALPVVSKSLPDPLKAEMRVDILAPVRGSGGRREMLPVMENVRVVSVGSRNIITETRGSGNGAGNFETLTIEVRPTEALVLEELAQQVQQVGAFQVLLRSPDDQRPTFIENGSINNTVLERYGMAPASQ